LEINLLKNKGKQSRSRQTIQTILDAAAQVLIVQGYSGATTNKIAEKSGFSVGTLYQYFENKEDVYRELVSHELGKIVAIVQEARVHDNLRNTLSSIITQILQVMGNDPMLVQALGQLTSGPFLEIRSAARVQTVAGVAALLQAHRDEITLPDLYLAIPLSALPKVLRSMPIPTPTPPRTCLSKDCAYNWPTSPCRNGEHCSSLSGHCCRHILKNT
jgi:AcrR family transcriptional regulator